MESLEPRRSSSGRTGRPAKFPVIKQQIRNAILQGLYKPSEKLPSFPNVASQLGVGDLTAKRAIDELVQEGWLTTRRGIGTFVRSRHELAPIVLTAPTINFLGGAFSVESVEAFHLANPGVRIIQTSEPNTDLFATATYALVVECIRTRQWLSLDKLHREFGGAEWELPSEVRRSGEWHGELFGLPLQVDLTLFQTNPRILASFDLPSPEHYLDRETYREILARCRADRDGDGVTECFGSFCHLASREWLLPFWQNGGRLDDRDGFFSDKALGSVDELWRLVHVDRTLPMEMPISHPEMYSKQIRKRFDAGKLAMRSLGIREVFHECPFPTQVLLPRFGPVSRQHFEGLVLGINKDCKYPEVAFKFLQFCYRRYVEDNPEFPFAVSDHDRQVLRQKPELRRLLTEGLECAVEPLHEGVPERTWAIEDEIFQWFRLFQDRATAMSRIQEHWSRWRGATGHDPKSNAAARLQ